MKKEINKKQKTTKVELRGIYNKKTTKQTKKQNSCKRGKRGGNSRQRYYKSEQMF
jgi:hypothetical protein